MLGVWILSLLYDAQARYGDAEPLYLRALAIDEEVWGPEHPRTAKVLGDLAAVRTALHRYDEAEELFSRVITIYENALGMDHSDTAMAINNLGALYSAQARYNDAERSIGRRCRFAKQSWVESTPTRPIASTTSVTFTGRSAVIPRPSPYFAAPCRSTRNIWERTIP